MAIIDVLEAARTSPRKRRLYAAVLLGLSALLLLATTARFAGLVPGRRVPTDFDIFHIAGRMVWRGEIGDVYYFARLSPLMASLFEGQHFLPWTYPPPFDLVVGALALLPLPAAYLVFTATTLAAYLAALRRLAPHDLVTTLIVFFPVLAVTIRCGQNGFLTGALVAVACLALRRGSAWAGVPLGLMVIKPHLAIAFGVLLLVQRRWAVLAVAAATAAAAAGLATALLGPAVWVAFLDGVREARIFLEAGLYPLFRMVSPYAALRSLDLPASLAGLAQVVSAVGALGAVVVAARRFSPTQALGVTALVTLLVSPYAYDYDMTIVAVGFALLLPDLVRLASPARRMAIDVLFLVSSGFGLVQSSWLAGAHQSEPDKLLDAAPVSLAAVGLVAAVAMVVRVVAGAREGAAAAEAARPSCDGARPSGPIVGHVAGGNALPG
ncbi:glycosyltransferase family 87 protein [Rhodoplanes azumiensis]|uniref:Glycosyltransferase family 87 protein n=1 Tax=Rhodoplanes azumiensis TaxID=1897628 RepID=A0ABW5ANG3_9BRAD